MRGAVHEWRPRGPIETGRSPRPEALVSRFSVAVGLALISLGVTDLLEEAFAGIVFFIPVAGVMLSALYGGFTPSLLTLGLVSAGYAYLFLPPRGSFEIASIHDLLRLGAFAITSLLGAAIAARVRSVEHAERLARKRAERLARSEQRTGQLYERLQAVTAACSAACTPEEIGRAVNEHGLRFLGASVVQVAVVADATHLRIVAVSEGVPEREIAPFRLLPIDGQYPTSEAARTRQPVFVASLEDCAARYPALAPLCTRLGFGAIVTIPLLLGDDLLGVLAFAFPGPRLLDDDETAYALAVARQAAQALARARSYENEQKAHLEAVRVGKLQEQLLAVVGHDLRTPLTAIITDTSLILRRGAVSPTDAATLTRIARSAQRMNGLIRDLLDFTRIKQGQAFPVRFSRIDAGEVARAALLEFDSTSSRRRIVLEVRGDVTMRADGDRIAQMLSNLVGNGLQHGGDSPVHVEVRGESELVVFRVHNGGPPIDAHVLQHIFEPFRRGRGDEEGARNGSVGLGLFIVREIAKAHGGEVEVTSSESTGTTFSVRLPRTYEAVVRERRA